MSDHTFAPGTLVRTRDREWVVLPTSTDDLLVLRPLGGTDDDTAAVLPALEVVTEARFAPPTVDDLGDTTDAALLRAALRIGFRSSGGPFRSLARLSVSPRAYQYVPLLLGLRQDTVRLLIADDVGIGKTVEAGLIATELIAQGDVERMTVLCSPALAEQWQGELRDKFGIEAEVVLPSTVRRLTRGLLLTESLFERYPYTVVSTDFIKSPTHRHEFLNHCPELVIVDEAHTAVADGAGSSGNRTQRYDLLRSVAADRSRHLVLVTATPHSGKEEGFRNLLGLLDPELANLDLDDAQSRVRLARHFVQRRRADIRSYLREDTVFPSDRLSREAPYELGTDYRAFFDRVLDYARERVTTSDGPGVSTVRQRVQWWSALALLRALSSSPAAAASTLRTRAAAAGATTVEEADALGRATILDTADDEALESMDITPGADLATDDESNGATNADRRRLLDLARSAEALAGPASDKKLATLIAQVREIIDGGDSPIVFCRFIDTADYVAEHLTNALGSRASVASVTGTLPPELRRARIDELATNDGPIVLVATDCLSEGVNLQDHFSAVIHYDLAWNPTRHEQREGRVDRFGQSHDIVRAVTIYGRDNPVDGIVLDVLLRKFQAIRAATGVSVPVPDRSDDVVGALIEGLILRGRENSDQLRFDLNLDERREQLHQEWESAAERERRSQTRYAQQAIHPEDVAREVGDARRSIGEPAEIEAFAIAALRALGATPKNITGGWTTPTAALPKGLRDSFPRPLADSLVLQRDLPAPMDRAVLTRTDSTVAAIAHWVLDTALDPLGDRSVASRAGVVRTSAVTRRTTLLLVRFRFHLSLPSHHGARQQVAEEARVLGFAGSPSEPEWLNESDAEALLRCQSDANLGADQAAEQARRILDSLGQLETNLNDQADALAADLLDAHRRVRSSSGAPRRGLSVDAQHPVDVLGVYIYLPAVTS